MSPLVAYFGKVRFLIKQNTVELVVTVPTSSSRGTEQAQTGQLSEQRALPQLPAPQRPAQPARDAVLIHHLSRNKPLSCRRQTEGLQGTSVLLNAFKSNCASLKDGHSTYPHERQLGKEGSEHLSSSSFCQALYIHYLS